MTQTETVCTGGGFTGATAHTAHSVHGARHGALRSPLCSSGSVWAWGTRWRANTCATHTEARGRMTEGLYRDARRGVVHAWVGKIVIDDTAANFDPRATALDSCVAPIYGCIMDPSADNYRVTPP